jgi:hypothetical protein
MKEMDAKAKLILSVKTIIEGLAKAQDEAYNSVLDTLELSDKEEEKFFDYMYNQGKGEPSDFLK